MGQRKLINIGEDTFLMGLKFVRTNNLYGKEQKSCRNEKNNSYRKKVNVKTLVIVVVGAVVIVVLSLLLLLLLLIDLALLLLLLLLLLVVLKGSIQNGVADANDPRLIDQRG